MTKLSLQFPFQPCKEEIRSSRGSPTLGLFQQQPAKQPQQPGRMADPVAKEVVAKVEVGQTNNMNMKKSWKWQSESPQSFWWNDKVLVGPTVLFGQFLSCLSLTDCVVRVFFTKHTFNF